MDLKTERIVVTGGAGFLGRYVQMELVKRGVPRGQAFIVRKRDYDLTHPEAVARMYGDLRPTVVIHLAAEVGGIGANRANPGRFFYANMSMGLHLIEQARIRNLRKFVQVGTVCAYPEHCPVPFREDDLWNGYPEPTNAPYGVAKRALLTMLQAYRQQYGLNGIYLLPVNLYGPGDNFDLETSHVIPAMIRKFCHATKTQAAEVSLWGSGDAAREFLYAADAARGIVLAAELYDDPAPVNLGTGQEIGIRELAHKIRSLAGFLGTITWDKSQPDGQRRRQLDTSRAFKRFGFRSRVGLDEGLRATVSWHRAGK